ncbi:hypothetical protein P154DRAFT_336730 [Amniculicola lignicola CBS 123094]|uniref:Uncharacterized protein n=1 Tax=Amniculicola lignicola CBS 123094 TaxID=1392246 RepID=A0A6A5WU73_9PLEO|nr:hypothetical protein P154DRAFT_336730 [Amniculicola lignicola CBS 123094]
MLNGEDSVVRLVRKNSLPLSYDDNQIKPNVRGELSATCRRQMRLHRPAMLTRERYCCWLILVCILCSCRSSVNQAAFPTVSHKMMSSLPQPCTKHRASTPSLSLRHGNIGAPPLTHLKPNRDNPPGIPPNYI